VGATAADLEQQCAASNGRTTTLADHAEGVHEFLPREDQRVLLADLKRTRQAYPAFKTQAVQDLISLVLQRYCVRHGGGYKQGQNELLAPLVALQDPPLHAAVLGLMFEAIVGRFAARWYVYNPST
jgi:hypothetical protein